MYAYDVGDGDNDVITSLAAHDFGLAWYEQDRSGAEPVFRQHLIMGSKPSQNRYGLVFSEPHSVALADIDGDGLKDIITGKTYYSHHKGSPLWDAGAVVYWFRLTRTEKGVDWVPYKADGEAGIGRQISILDINGDKRFFGQWYQWATRPWRNQCGRTIVGRTTWPLMPKRVKLRAPCPTVPWQLASSGLPTGYSPVGMRTRLGTTRWPRPHGLFTEDHEGFHSLVAPNAVAKLSGSQQLDPLLLFLFALERKPGLLELPAKLRNPRHRDAKSAGNFRGRKPFRQALSNLAVSWRQRVQPGWEINPKTDLV